MKLTKDQALELLVYGHLPELELKVESDEQFDSRRWTSVHELVVRTADGKLYATTYERGLTESQYVEPFEDLAEVEFCEVEKIPVTTYEYKRV